MRQFNDEILSFLLFFAVYCLTSFCMCCENLFEFELEDRMNAIFEKLF